MKSPAFSPGQKVSLCFYDGAEVPAQIVEKLDDAKMKPLKNYWLVRPINEAGALGFPFGFSAQAIKAA